MSRVGPPTIGIGIPEIGGGAASVINAGALAVAGKLSRGESIVPGSDRDLISSVLTVAIEDSFAFLGYTVAGSIIHSLTPINRVRSLLALQSPSHGSTGGEAEGDAEEEAYISGKDLLRGHEGWWLYSRYSYFVLTTAVVNFTESTVRSLVLRMVGVRADSFKSYHGSSGPVIACDVITAMLTAFLVSPLKAIETRYLIRKPMDGDDYETVWGTADSIFRKEKRNFFRALDGEALHTMVMSFLGSQVTGAILESIPGLEYGRVGHLFGELALYGVWQLATYPLFVAKTRLSAQGALERGSILTLVPWPKTRYTGVVDALARIGKEEGAGALWQGAAWDSTIWTGVASLGILGAIKASGV